MTCEPLCREKMGKCWPQTSQGFLVTRLDCKQMRVSMRKIAALFFFLVVFLLNKEEMPL